MRRAAHLDVIGVGVLRKPDLAGRIILDDLSPAQKPLMSFLIHGETSQGRSALSLRPGYSQVVAKTPGIQSLFVSTYA